MDTLELYKSQIDAIDKLLTGIEKQDKYILSCASDIFYYRFFNNQIVKEEVMDLVPNENIAAVSNTLEIVWTNYNNFSGEKVLSSRGSITINKLVNNLSYIKNLISMRVQTIEERQETIEQNCFMNDLIMICKLMKANSIYIQNCDENVRNDYVRDMLEFKGYYSKDQTRHGMSKSGKKSGEVDILVCKTKTQKEIVIESQNLQSCDKNKIFDHFDRIFKYDTNGNSFNILLSYVNVADFPKFVLSYKRLFEQSTRNPICLSISIESLDDSNSISKVITEHCVNGNKSFVYHILVFFKT